MQASMKSTSKCHIMGEQGTALTEEEEFHEVYNLDVTVVPTHKPRQRIDHEPRVFLTSVSPLVSSIFLSVRCCQLFGIVGGHCHL